MAQERFPKENMLYQTLQRCSHKNQNLVATDAANIMFNYPNQFSPLCAPLTEAGSIKQLLELKGELNIQHKGSRYSIITSLSYPYIYPDAPAIIRIYNPSPQKFAVNQHFIQGASPDQSVVNIHLSELQTWNQHKSIARLMIQLIQELQQHFPFYDKSGQATNVQANNNNVNNYYGQNSQQRGGYNNSYGYGGQQPGYQVAGQQQGYQGAGQQPGYQAGYQQAQYGYQQGNQQQPGYQSPGYQQPLYGGQAAYQQPNYGQGNQQGYNQPQINVEQQLKEKCLKEFEDKLTKLVKEIKQQKKYTENVIQICTSQESVKATSIQINQNLDQQIDYLNKENEKLTNLLSSNDSLQLNEETVLNIVKEEDAYSGQLLEVIADIQTLKEQFHFISEKFRKTEVPFEQLVKLTKYYSEQQFYCLLLQKKLLGNLKK